MSAFVFILLGLVAGDFLWWRAARRELHAPSARALAAAWFALAFGGFAMVVGSRFAGVTWDDLLPRPVLSIVFVWHLLALPLWLLWRLVRAVAVSVRRRPPASAGPGEISRREFFAASAKFAPAVFAGCSAALAETQLESFRTRPLEVPLTSLPPALDGLTIAHVSDLHVGRFTRSAVLERIVRETNKLEADLVLLTGDLINFALRDLPAGVDLVRSLRARHGVFFCEGNHDLIENPAAFHREMLRSGLPFLRGEAHTLAIRGEKLQVLGLPWTHSDAAHASAVEHAERLRDEAAFPILLAHHPHVFDAAGRFPLTLAGHTHGGQLMLNDRVGFGPWFFRYWSGLYRREGRALVVSNGAGNWFPIRVGAPAEILRLTLRRA